MARADQVKALLRAFVDRHDDRFLSIALQVAADEAQRGHNKLATELRDLIDQARAQTAPKLKTGPLPIAQPKGELADLLTVRYPQQHLNQLVASAEVVNKLNRVLLEQRQHVRLSGHGLAPRRKLLLMGPPGTGKTFTAGVLATELRLPLFVARFDSMLTKFMGESASKLRLIFESLKMTRGVYLFDEFDSLGLQRGSQHDVAEMRRTLNMFLQLIEQDKSESLIIAATNHGDALDNALFRRFDDVVRYDLPRQSEIVDLLKNGLAHLANAELDFGQLAHRAIGLSQAEVVKACEDAMKDAVLQDLPSVSTASILQHLDERAQSQKRLL